jgi:hypothetical protein
LKEKIKKDEKSNIRKTWATWINPHMAHEIEKT